MLIMTTNSPAEWPAIVQAIGSILAILATGGLYWLQTTSDTRRRAEELRRVRANIRRLLIAEVSAIQELLSFYFNKYDEQNPGPFIRISRSVGETIRGSFSLSGPELRELEEGTVDYMAKSTLRMKTLVTVVLEAAEATEGTAAGARAAAEAANAVHHMQARLDNLKKHLSE